VVAPDLGAVKLAERIAERLDAPAAFVRKTRLTGSAVEVGGIVGEVAGWSPVVVDDMISTGGTIVAAVEALCAAGCEGPVQVAAVHGLLVGDAEQRLGALGLRHVTVTDSLPPAAGTRLPRRVESLADLLATAIGRLHQHGPVDELTSHG
jgi:ribose-phosphate pyrophosphokinase